MATILLVVFKFGTMADDTVGGGWVGFCLLSVYWYV